MARNVLPKFQEYLLSRGIVAEKNVSFYAWWAGKYLSFSNRHEDLSRELKFERFLDGAPRASPWSPITILDYANGR